MGTKKGTFDEEEILRSSLCSLDNLKDDILVLFDYFRFGLMSFPKAKRFTDHISQGPGPNAYDVVFSGSERLVSDQ